jgi:type I protein arginine methyltransferase
MLACRFGAKKVISVEPNALIDLAKEFARQNDCGGKIEFIQKLSTEIELEEKADILVCDLHGNFPFFESSIATIIDARKRLIKPGGVLIPRRETVFFAVAECEEIYEKNISRYLREFSGIKMNAARRLLTNRMMNTIGKESRLLSDPQVFAALDYEQIEDTSFSANLSFRIGEQGIAHGLRGWFECELGDGQKTTNAPGNTETVYGAPFLPFDEPVEVKKGDKIEAAISAAFEKGDYTWRWQTRISDEKETKAEFTQSTLTGLFLSPGAVLKQSEFFTPLPNEDALIDSFILNKMDGENLQGDIADELLNQFPDKFDNFENALNRVSQLSLRYSR